MQQDASELEQQRERKLAEVGEREREDRERDDASRAKTAKYGGRADFVNKINKTAGDLALGDRIGRNGTSRRMDDE